MNKIAIAFLMLISLLFGGEIYAQNSSAAWYTLPNTTNKSTSSAIKCTLDRSYKMEEDSIPKKEGSHLACVTKKDRIDFLSSPARKSTQFVTDLRSNPPVYTVEINGRTLNKWHPFCNGSYPLYVRPGDPTSSLNLCDYINQQALSSGKLTIDEVFGNSTARLKDLYVVGNSVYKHDITPPTCARGIVTYKDTGETYGGEWTYKTLVKKGECQDSPSGCLYPFSDPEDVTSYNGSKSFKVELQDRAQNKASPSCSSVPLLIDNDIPILLDTVSIKGGENDVNVNISKTTISQGSESNAPKFIVKDLGSVDLYADPIDLHVKARDPDDQEGVSGIQEIAYTAHKCGDTSDIVGQYSTKFDPLNPTGKKINSDNKNAILPIKTFSKKEGCYTVKIIITDNAKNYSHYIFNIKVVPNLRLKTTTAVTPSHGLYANKFDAYKYKLRITDSWGNPIHNKKLTDLRHVEGGIQLPNKTQAFVFSESDIDTSINGDSGFELRSYMPGSFKNQFEMNYEEWDTKYQSNGTTKVLKIPNQGEIQTKEFLKLYTSKMDFASGGIINTDEVTARLVIGSENEVKLQEKREQAADVSKVNLSTVVIDNTGIEAPADAPYVFMGEGGVTNTKPKKCTFTSAIYKNICFYAQALKGITSKDELNIWARPMISYKFTDGTSVQYQLSPTPTGLSNEPVTLSGGTLNGIYIGGQQRSNGKDGIVSNMENIGGLKGFEFTNAIRKQVALVTRNRKADGKVVNGVLYTSGDQSLSMLNNISGWETVIVEDGNLTIDESFNDTTKNTPRGIIVITKDNTNKGNIYITPNVTKISAGIFADGSIESVDSSGNIFTKSDMTRTKALTRQLMIFGTILSRNTIGGAILGELGEEYVLPGSKATSSIDEAVRFDLSFLRMYNYGSDGSSSWSETNADKDWHQGHSESTVVIPNPKFLSNPPAVFSFKE